MTLQGESIARNPLVRPVGHRGADGDRQRRNWSLAGCFCIYLLVNFDISLFGYAVPEILNEFGISLTVIGSILSASFVASMIGVVVSSRLADRYGRGPVAAVLLALSACSVGSLGLVGSLGALFAMRALAGGLSAGLTPVADTIVIENVPAHWRGIAMGVLACGYPAGWYLASLVAAPLLQTHGWRAVFLCAFAVAPLAIPFGWMLMGAGGGYKRGDPTIRRISRESIVARLLNVAHRRTTMGFALLSFSFGGAYAGSAFFFATYFTQARGYTPAAAAALIGTSYGLAVIGYLATALVGEFVMTRRNTYALWMVLGAAALLGLVWVSHSPQSDMLCYALMAIFVFSTSAVLPVMVGELLPTEIRASGIGLCISAPMMLGFVVFPLLVPRMVAVIGWSWTLSLVIVPLLLLSAAGALMVPNRRSGTRLVDQPDAVATAVV